jgi:putative transposase
MSEKFKGLYRNETFRAQWWNYNRKGAYHITICTDNRTHFFGEIKNGKMHLSEIGKLVQQFWLEIPQHFPHIKLDEFVVMPDHFHGILISNGCKTNKKRDANSSDHCMDVAMQHPRNNNIINIIKNGSDIDINNNIDNQKNKPPETYIFSKQFFSNISPKSGSIPVVIRSFKSVVSKHARQIRSDFKWQKLYHDRIIRDMEEFTRVKYYIRNNVKNWNKIE